MGCGTSLNEFEQAYDPYGYEDYYELPTISENVDYFAENLCVSGLGDILADKDSYITSVSNAISNQVTKFGAGVFNVSTSEVTYAQNIYDRFHPASCTKILTAYIILRDCDLSAMVTVSKNALDIDSDSSVAGLKVGDVISVKDLLYGLILPSGNDAAVALAEHHSGSVEAFAEEMNRTASDLGATNSHFMNPHGLTHAEHYTTVYDMYLIFQEALKNPEFKELVNTKNYTAGYTNAEGQKVSKSYRNTNRYFTGEYTPPKGMTILGGKTGTTNAAKYCLVLYSQNAEGEDIISIVFKADCRSNLYYFMNLILKEYAK